MSQLRMRARIPNAKIIGTALLQGYQLCFHKISQIDGSGKCGIIQAQQNDKVYGVVYALSDEDQILLDRIEGEGVGYERVNVEVAFTDGKLQNAVTYRALTIDPQLKPFYWYKEHVVRGARENDLPEKYIQKIESIETIEDHNQKRQIKEMSIYSENPIK